MLRNNNVFNLVKENNIPALKGLIENYPDTIYLIENGQTLIEYAASLKHWDMVTMVLNEIQSVNSDQAKKLSLVLFQAIEDKRPAAEIKLLVTKRADLSTLNKDQKTPIAYAAWQSNWQATMAIVNAKNTDNNDSYHYGSAVLATVIANEDSITEACLKAKSSTNWTYLDNNDTALHRAIRRSNGDAEFKSFKLLMQYNALLNLTNKENQTPIQLAASLGYWNIVNYIAKNKPSDADDKAKYSEALFAAMKANRPDDEIAQLVSAGANLSAINEGGITPLQVARTIAVDSNNWRYVKAIVKAAKNIKGTERFGEVLIQTLIHGQSEIALDLLAAGKMTEWYEESATKNTSLHLAAKIQNENLIRELIAAGATLTKENKNGLTPIQFAASEGYWGAVKAIVKYNKNDNKNEARYGDALLRAVEAGELEIVDLLIEANASRTWKIANTGDKCVHEAVIKNNGEMLALLLKHQFAIDETNKDGLTPIEIACALGRWECADQLRLHKKLIFNNKAKAGLAFLDAIRAGQLQVAEYLMQSGASTTECSPLKRNSALHIAAETNNLAAIKFLVKNSADQTALNKEGLTPIELACAGGNWDCVQWLLENNSNTPKNPKLIQDLHYEEALLSAIKKGNYLITKLLLQMGAPCSRFNSEFGNIALHCAVKNNEDNPEMVALLIAYGADPKVKNAKGEDTFALAKKLGKQNCLNQLSGVEPGKKLSENPVIRSAEIVESLTENAIAGEAIPAAVLEWESSEKNMLTADLCRLQLQRESMIASGITSKEALAPMSVMIATINSLLHFPSRKIELDALPPIDEKQHVTDYLNRKQTINNYINYLKRFAKELDQKIVKTTWRVQSFAIKSIFGYENWVEGTPTHMHQIRDLLAKMLNAKTIQQIVEAHSALIDVLTQLIANKGRRHADTKNFYQETLEELKSMSFNVAAVQPIYITQPAQSELLKAPLVQDKANLMANPQYSPTLMVIPSENLYLIPIEQPATDNSSQQQFSYPSTQASSIYPIITPPSPEEINAKEVEARKIEGRKIKAKEIEARKIEAREIAEAEALRWQLPNVSYASLGPSSPVIFAPPTPAQGAAPILEQARVPVAQLYS